MRALFIFVAETVLILMLTVNFRACAKGHTAMTIGTDGLIAGLGFTLIRWIAEASGQLEQSAYVAGAMVGAWLGMTLTRHWKEAV